MTQRIVIVGGGTGGAVLANRLADRLDLTDGEGVDAAIEALGSNATFQNCVEVTKPGGTISNVGYHGEGEYVAMAREHYGDDASEYREAVVEALEGIEQEVAAEAD